MQLSKEVKGAWKSRVEELPSYKKMRDEKKRKKTVGQEDFKSFFILCLTNKCLRIIKLVIRAGNKTEVAEKSIAVDTRPRLANSLLQTLKNSDESFTVFLSTAQGKVELYNLQLASLSY